MRNESILQRVMRDNVVAIVVAMVLLVPLIAPISQNVRVWRNALFQGLGALLLLALLARLDWRGGPRRLGAVMRSGLNLPLLLYFAWAGASVLRAPYRAFSVNELLLLGAGVVICLVISWHITHRGQLQVLCQALVLILVLSLFFGLFIQESPGEAGLRSSFGSRMMFGAFLAMMTPFLTALALSEGAQGTGSGPRAGPGSAYRHDRSCRYADPGARTHSADAARARQLCLEGVSVLSGLSLILTQCRSAWTGGVVGLLLLLALVWRSHVRSRACAAGRVRMASVGMGSAYLLLIVGLAGACIFEFGGASDTVRHRFGTITDAAHGHDNTFNWRVRKWRQALPLIAARPFTGWGLGSYPFHQAPGSGPSASAGMGSHPRVVAMAGVSLDEQAHNEYVQLTAELGLVGLALYLLIFASFFAKAGHALGRLPRGRRQFVLMGCIAAVAAQMVDAVGNPAWRFPQCSLFFWLLLGMGAACVRMAYAIPAAASMPADGRVLGPAHGSRGNSTPGPTAGARTLPSRPSSEGRTADTPSCERML